MELMPRGYSLGLTVGVTYGGRECHNVVVFESRTMSYNLVAEDMH